MTSIQVFQKLVNACEKKDFLKSTISETITLSAIGRIYIPDIRISPERTDAVAFLFLKPSYDNNGFRKHQVLRKMSQDQELKDEKNPSSLTELW